jgi:SAM-dependent methyltransferase
MLKMFHKRPHSGSSPDFWEENWAASHFEESVRFCAVDPLRPLFEKYLRPDSLMLEGGCGMGNYITYYAARGFKVVGVDFAQKALKTLHQRQPDLMLAAGDVARLPFDDEVFDVYYSGGVVEHFEGGAEAALKEARRVLKRDGALLISVPYFNPLRRFLAPFRKQEWQVVSRAEVGGDGITGKQFFQYAYKSREFENMLTSAGLRTVDRQPYAILWGLSEIPFFGIDEGEFPELTAEQASEEVKRVDADELIDERQGSLLKRLAVNEDARIPVLGLGVRMLRWSAANMMMYVCKRA